MSWPSGLQEHPQPRRDAGQSRDHGRVLQTSLFPPAQAGWHGAAPCLSVGRRDLINGPEEFWPARKHPTQK